MIVSSKFFHLVDQNPQLEHLALNNNQLTDISALAKLKHLEEVDLRNNPNLTKAKIEKLQKALPKCRIYHNAKE